jgi:hypothetical protein
MPRTAAAVVAICAFALTASAQTPQPFPRPGGAAPPAAPAPQSPPAPAPASPLAPRTAPAAQPLPPPGDAPTAASLGIPLYPSAQFLASYDAGRAQRYYLFGTTASFAEVVAYYQVQLDERGDTVYKDPPTHMFTGGPLPRYRDETMAFPPSVTVKDFARGGTSGYPNPRLGAQPGQFPTIVMIVPAPPGAPVR